MSRLINEQGEMYMKAIKLVTVSTRLPEDVIKRWHEFALQQSKNKEKALAQIIIKGTQKPKKFTRTP